RTSIQARHAELKELEIIRPRILNLLQQAKEAGLKMGIASSSSRQWSDRFLDALGIREFFDFYCTADTVTNVKHDPELYLQALSR
ncbi:HAD hydrolase-like protein, partial [Lysinibacillus sp. D4A3_S15]|uniref:HAD hydrolase-like protein n=1 Tax=Lysinibacillus sp. D4A3_S15 TaxID=2941227 RepID=UPI0020BD7B9B